MLFDWYKVFNLDEFHATGLVSRTVTFNIEGIGVKEFLLTRGNETSVLIDGALLPIGFQGKNPYGFEDRAIYLDVNNDVWIGFPQ